MSANYTPYLEKIGQFIQDYPKAYQYAFADPNDYRSVLKLLRGIQNHPLQQPDVRSITNAIVNAIRIKTNDQLLKLDLIHVLLCGKPNYFKQDDYTQEVLEFAINDGLPEIIIPLHEAGFRLKNRFCAALHLGYGNWVYPELIAPTLQYNPDYLNAVVQGSMEGIGAYSQDHIISGIKRFMAWQTIEDVQNRVSTAFIHWLQSRGRSMPSAFQKDTTEHIIAQWIGHGLDCKKVAETISLNDKNKEEYLKQFFLRSEQVYLKHQTLPVSTPKKLRRL